MKSLYEIMGIPLIENKKDDEHRIVFKETDPELPFPNDTIKALEREINKKAKDLKIEWENTIKLIDHAFRELDVPKPTITQHERWTQYMLLIDYAVEQLKDARGIAGSYRTTNKYNNTEVF